MMESNVHLTEATLQSLTGKYERKSFALQLCSSIQK